MQFPPNVQIYIYKNMVIVRIYNKKAYLYDTILKTKLAQDTTRNNKGNWEVHILM